MPGGSGKQVLARATGVKNERPARNQHPETPQLSSAPENNLAALNRAARATGNQSESPHPSSPPVSI